MEQSASIDKRLENIKRLGGLVPQLWENVHEYDYYNILKIYKHLINEPKSADFGFMKDFVQNLGDTVRTVELYRTNEKSRKLLSDAADILKEIIRN